MPWIAVKYFTVDTPIIKVLQKSGKETIFPQQTSEVDFFEAKSFLGNGCRYGVANIDSSTNPLNSLQVLLFRRYTRLNKTYDEIPMRAKVENVPADSLPDSKFQNVLRVNDDPANPVTRVYYGGKKLEKVDTKDGYSYYELKR